MADAVTPNLNLTKPEVGASTDTWGQKINTDLETIDGLFSSGALLKVSNGGTGASTAAAARTNLGVPGIATANTFTEGQVISLNSSTASGVQVTQAGTAPAISVDSGSIVAGATARYAGPSSTQSIVQVNGANAAQLAAWSTSTGPTLQFVRSKSSTLGTHTSVASGDVIALAKFAGSDGTAFIPAAEIKVEVDGTPGTNDMPGRIVFSTTKDGESAVTERLRIGAAGQIGIAGANYGTAGQVLVSGGDAAAPSWSSIGGITYILSEDSIGTGTSYEKTSTTITGTYKKIEIILNSVTQASGNARTLQIEVGTGSSAYAATIDVSGSIGSGRGISGIITIHNADLTSGSRLVLAQSGEDGNNGNYFSNAGATGTVGGVVNKFKLSYTTSTAFSSGKVTVIGYT